MLARKFDATMFNTFVTNAGSHAGRQQRQVDNDDGENVQNDGVQ